MIVSLFIDQAKIKHMPDTFGDPENIEIILGHKESGKRDEHVRKIITSQFSHEIFIEHLLYAKYLVIP